MRLMQFLRCIELMQRGSPVSVARIAACTRTSRESVRAWMLMLAAHGRAESLDGDAAPPLPRRGAPPEWWQWTAGRAGASAPAAAQESNAFSEMAKSLAQARAQRNPWGLTLREAEVMTAVCVAPSHKVAARELGLAPLSVKSATARVGKKMGIGGPGKYAEWQRWLLEQEPR
jgi:hypothetical protein